MATYIPTGFFQRPVRVNYSNELQIPHSNYLNQQTTTPAPFFLQRPTIASDLASKLIPTDVDLHSKKNMEEHSTSHYDISGLVLRRGQAFSFTVTFNRDFDPEQHQLFVRLAIGSRSMISKRTQIRLLVDGPPRENGWSAISIPTENAEEKNKQKKKNYISLQVNSPSDAIIGKYSLLLEVRPIKKDDQLLIPPQNLTLFLFEIDIYFLYNPWNKDDVCALSSSEQIDEYVMNEHGQIHLGSSDKPQAIPWYFGQFERSVLLTALALLDKAQLPAQNRIDPAVILRILSSKICSNPGTNSGIFSSSFDIRLASSETNGFTSSPGILKQYLLSNGRSVQGGSGSNWQHAAILCSLSRSLGIPSRIVTIYNTACRADGTENNDIHWDTKQRPLKQLNSDLICSSHVWNECWMRRMDLSNQEQDWQIVDSTPVQMCDGIRRTGPCSVSSLKKGDLGSRWDSSFIHSAIHGNKSHWIVYPDGNMELSDVQENIIGTKVITRSLKDEFQPEDITNQYKDSKKFVEEKDSVAERLKNDVKIDVKLPDDIQFGDHILIELNAKNQSNETRTLITALTVCITSHTGQRLYANHNQPIQTLNLESGKDGNIQLKINSEQYINHGKPENITVKYYIHSQIKETDQIFTSDENIIFSQNDFIKPILDEDVIEIGKPVQLGIQIANIFSRPIHNGRIHIDGLGINQIVSVNRSFAPKESTVFHTKLYPKRIGVSRLYVTFTSNNITSSTQSIPLEIVSEPIKKPEEPVKQSDETVKKSEESTTQKSEEVVKKSDETVKKPEESTTQKSEEVIKKSEESPKSSEETNKKPEEPIKKPDEPLLKTDTEKPTVTETKSETKVEDKETVSLPKTPEKPPIKEEGEEKPLITPSPAEGESSEKKAPDSITKKPDTSSTEHADEDSEELDSKKDPARLQPKTTANSSVPHGSTLSIDSLDMSNDRRQTSNNNNH